jgi:tetratricopeptide (TPR) repeat protein
VARLAWEHVEAGRLDAARRWLDGVRDGLGANSEPGYRLSMFWPRGSTADREAMLDAAAALMALDPRDTRGIDRLRAGLAGAPSEGARQRFRLALGWTFLARQQPADAVPHGERALAAEPNSPAAITILCRALLASGRPADCRAALTSRLQRAPGEPGALRLLATLENNEGRYEEAERAVRTIASAGRANGSDWNNLAWGALFRPPVTEQALRDAQQSLADGAPNPARLHTLAMLYAELGRIREARDVLWQVMDVAGTPEPNAPIWLVVGRIAEQIGATDAAITAYSRVDKPRQPWQQSFSGYLLAQRRLAALRTK